MWIKLLKKGKGLGIVVDSYQAFSDVMTASGILNCFQC